MIVSIMRAPHPADYSANRYDDFLRPGDEMMPDRWATVVDCLRHARNPAG
ncbi:hypothetical protein AB0K25_12445 [Micromonospora sp. NPDC049257]